VAEERNPKLRNWIERTVQFPNSMVDRITPATTDADRDWLVQEYGIADGWPVVSEPFRQWVIEDSFEGDRPPWEEVGVTVTSNVEPYELMKLRLLNAGHSCLAYLAALAGIERVDSAMAEPRIDRFLRRFLESEAGPVLPEIPGIDVPAYMSSLLERFSNPAIGDQISRLCLDGSAKFPKFLLPTVRAQLAGGGPIDLSALALAGWCAYLLGVADNGALISHASDPDLETARSYAAASIKEPSNFLAYRAVFGDDLPREARFVEAFGRALESLRSVGVRTTLDASLTSGER
jgi:mannitol 2-dehydrogenase